MCVHPKTCADYTTGESGQACSNGGAFDDGTGNLLTCLCVGGAKTYCISGTPPNGTVVTGSEIGSCCTDTAACGTQCNIVVPNTCINGDNTSCGSGVCGARAGCNTNTDMCVTCASLGEIGSVGSPCSNGNAFDIGSGTLITCPCNNGLVCSNGNGMAVFGSTKGTCCQNTATCPSGTSNECNVPSVTDTCSGQLISCGTTCPSGQHCNAASDGTCVDDNNCANIGVRMSLPNPTEVRGGTTPGNPCNDRGTFYMKTGGGFFSCPCTPGLTCTGETNSSEGVCTG